MPDSILRRRSAALLRVDLGNGCFARRVNFTRKLQKNHKNLGASSPTELRKPFGSLIRGDSRQMPNVARPTRLPLSTRVPRGFG